MKWGWLDLPWLDDPIRSPPTHHHPTQPEPITKKQYVAFYDWMRRVFGAQALVHFGMHGTAEWLPGSPLGNTATTWPDILMGVSKWVCMYECDG